MWPGPAVEAMGEDGHGEAKSQGTQLQGFDAERAHHGHSLGVKALKVININDAIH